MVKIKCLVVDDEPLAQRVMEKYIASIPSLELVKKCSNALEASSYLLQHPVDVIFLDIKMPEFSGMDFLKTLSNPPQIILTTAYSQYALEGYEYSVLDYLLKPVSFERFLKAVNKIKKPETEKGSGFSIRREEQDFIFLKTDRIHHRIKYQDIIYIQGYGNYVKIFTDEKRILFSQTMSELESLLPENLFIRVHKSYIIHLRKIEKIRENKIIINNVAIPIGRTYKKKVNEILKTFHLSHQ